MKKYFGILVPTFVSMTAITLAVACAPQNAVDSVNARRGQPCDNVTKMCQTNERVYGKLGADTLMNDMKKELDAEKDVNQKAANNKEAKNIRNINLNIQDAKVIVTVVDLNKRSVVLVGDLKDQKSDLTSEDKTIAGTLQCLDAGGKCVIARLDLLKATSINGMVATGKVNPNSTLKADIKTIEKNGKAKIKAVIRNSTAEIATVETDVKDKPDTFKKLYEMIMAKIQGRHDQNSVKDILVQTSEVVNGTSFASIVIISNENEVIGLESVLEIVGRDTSGGTARAIAKNINADLLKKILPAGGEKKTMMNSIDAVTLTKIESGNKLGIQFTFKRTDGNKDHLQSTLTLSQISAEKEVVKPVPVADVVVPSTSNREAGDADAAAISEGLLNSVK